MIPFGENSFIHMGRGGKREPNEIGDESGDAKLVLCVHEISLALGSSNL